MQRIMPVCCIVRYCSDTLMSAQNNASMLCSPDVLDTPVSAQNNASLHYILYNTYVQFAGKKFLQLTVLYSNMILNLDICV